MRRVAITGLGIVSPIGIGWRIFWDRLIEGRSGIGPVRSFSTEDYPVHIGGEVDDFVPEDYVRRQAPDSMGRASQFAIAAGRMAIEDAELALENHRPRRVGVCMGTTSGEPQLVEQYNDARKAQARDRISGARLLRYPSNVIPSHLAIELGMRGPCLTIPAACAAGNYALGYAADLIRAGRVDVMLAGGADAFSRIPYAGFARLGAIAPERCQPFDLNRRGMIPAEGAAVLTLEPLDAALERRAKVYAELLGYGLSCDAHHMTGPEPSGSGAARAMQMALAQSQVNTSQVDYVCAHGTGTPNNDKMESAALALTFGDRSPSLPMSSIKSMLGHTMGAASAIEAAACALALDTGVIPPTINYETPDPECDIDCVANAAREIGPKVVLSNAYAFGGNNASICLSRYER